jgi:cytosine/adenosine deaminase-related metal-dependent hydrolase
LLVSNVKLLNEPAPVNISVSDDKILSIGKELSSDSFRIHFTNALAVPGLINSHDHLDFNCFSPFGKKKYNNYTEWGNDIHRDYKEEIKEVLDIPQNLRVAWGMYKNLLAGITTVVNHGDFLKIENPLINVCQNTQNLHSVQFQNRWKWKLNNPLLKHKSVVMHVGEGVDAQSADEIDELIKYNWLKRNLIGVHGVAMNSEQAGSFKGLVWCPESNAVLLNRHADITELKKNTCLVFGTDSTLTGSWNIWEHLRLARSLRQAHDQELFRMVSSSPAILWNINTGELKAGKDADMLIVENRNASWNDFYNINPEDILMVVHGGKIRLFDSSISDQLKKFLHGFHGYSSFYINGTEKMVEGNLPELIRSIGKYNPGVRFPVSF